MRLVQLRYKPNGLGEMGVMRAHINYREQKDH
jgi:hypothetical protein